MQEFFKKVNRKVSARSRSGDPLQLTESLAVEEVGVLVLDISDSLTDPEELLFLGFLHDLLLSQQSDPSDIVVHVGLGYHPLV